MCECTAFCASIRSFARRLRRTNDDLCDMIFTDVPGRVAKQLLDLTKRFGRPDSDGLRVDHESVLVFLRRATELV